MRNDKQWDELADRIGTAYQNLELFIATRDLRLAGAEPAERQRIVEEGTSRVRAMAEAVEALLKFDLENI